MIGSYSASVVHGLIQNLATGGAMECLLNPEQITTAVGVNYQSRATIGGDFARLQYMNTGNTSVEFTLQFDRRIFMRKMQPGGGWDANREKIIAAFEELRRFLLALCYPVGSATDPIRKAPPAVLLVWPYYLAIKAVVRSLRFRDTQWDVELSPVVFTAEIQFEELRTYRLTSAEVYKNGMVRGR